MLIKNHADLDASENVWNRYGAIEGILNNVLIKTDKGDIKVTDIAGNRECSKQFPFLASGVDGAIHRQQDQTGRVQDIRM